MVNARRDTAVVDMQALQSQLAARNGQYERDLGLDAIVQGGARGADALAKEWAVARHLQCETFYADWDAYGKRAGMMRNQKMLDEAKPSVVIAFPQQGAENRGTNGMIDLARKAGVTVHVIDPVPPAHNPDHLPLPKERNVA